MPPKKGGVNKSVQKAKDKLVEDKTFGLKNKNKSKVVQKYVKTVATNVRGDAQNEEMRRKRKAEREAAEREKRELSELFRPAVSKPQAQVKPEDGVDPKTLLCQYFKAGFCARGNKCKYSHDLNLDKTAKINLYNDPRANAQDMEDWDDAKLKDAVNTAEDKRRAAGKLPPTNIICKHFLQAVEDRKYGWFWKCPNGGDGCHYQHCLPPGYVLKDKTKTADTEEEEEKVAFEEELEIARTQLETRTPITTDMFFEWKRKRDKKREKATAKRTEDALNAQRKKHGSSKIMSGRDLFEFKPEIFQDDADAADVTREETDWGAVGSSDAVKVDEDLFGGEDLGDLDLGDIDEEEMMALAGDGEVLRELAEEEEEEEEEEEAEGESKGEQGKSAFKPLSEEQLQEMSKKELIEFIRENSDTEYAQSHQLGGQIKNVVKKKTIEELVNIYRELAAFRSATG